MGIPSNLQIMYTNRVSQQSASLKYPAGKSRMETAGIIVFACLMSALSAQLILESIKNIIHELGMPGNEVGVFEPICFSILCVTIFVLVFILSKIFWLSSCEYPCSRSQVKHNLAFFLTFTPHIDMMRLQICQGSYFYYLEPGSANLWTQLALCALLFL